MSAADTPQRFRIELPPDPAYVATVRLFASSVARQAGVAEEVMDDVKLAIGEACSRALGGSDADTPLWVAAELDAGRLMFQISQGDVGLPPPDEVDTPTPAELAKGLSLELVTALFDDAEVVSASDGRPVMRFSVPAA